MSRKPQRSLHDRIFEAAEAVLASQKQVSPIDVMNGIGWLNPNVIRFWRQGQIECLENAIQTDRRRISEALELVGAWAAAKGLVPTEMRYLSRPPDPKALRFSVSGDPAVEQRYCTHFLTVDLSKRERLTDRTSRAPDLVAVVPLKVGWTCHRCGGTGDLLIMENPGPACLRCLGLGDLDFLPSGDALLTRRVKAKSGQHVVVVKFSRTRKRYERQGLLVEPQALRDVRRDLERPKPGNQRP